MIKPLSVEHIAGKYPLKNGHILTLGMNAMLIEEGGRRVLLDPGCAEFLPAGLQESYGLEIPVSLEEQLARLGFGPERITDVVFTHLHFDHGSGAFKREPGRIVKRFFNADYHVLKRHFEYASRPDRREGSSFMTALFRYVDRIHWLEDWKFPWLEFRRYQGHTKEMVVPVILQGENPLVYLTDLIPMEIFLEQEVYSGYDLDPETAVKEKQEFLNGVSCNSKFIFFHDPQKDSINYPNASSNTLRI